MNLRARRRITTAGVALLAGITGGILTHALTPEPPKLDIATEVQKVLDERSGATRVELSLTQNGTRVTTDGSCAATQRFAPSRTDTTYLDGKVGFTYQLDDLKRVPHPGAKHLPIGLMFDTYGTSAKFSVNDDLHPHAYELLTFSHRNGKAQGAFVFISDNDRDGLPDHISLTDRDTTVTASIVREGDGTLKYAFFDEKSAREVYDFYTRAYRAFKKEHDIDNRIADYTPVLEIIQIDTSTIPGE